MVDLQGNYNTPVAFTLTDKNVALSLKERYKMTKRSVKNTQKNITKNTSIFNENEYENAKLLVLGYPIPSIKPNSKSIRLDNK